MNMSQLAHIFIVPAAIAGVHAATKAALGEEKTAEKAPTAEEKQVPHAKAQDVNAIHDNSNNTDNNTQQALRERVKELEKELQDQKDQRRENSDKSSTTTGRSRSATTVSDTSTRNTRRVSRNPNIILQPEKWEDEWTGDDIATQLWRSLDLNPSQLKGYTADMAEAWTDIIRIWTDDRSSTQIPSTAIDQLFRISLFTKGGTQESLTKVAMKLKSHSYPAKFKNAIREFDKTQRKKGNSTKKEQQQSKKKSTHVPNELWKTLTKEQKQLISWQAATPQ